MPSVGPFGSASRPPTLLSSGVGPEEFDMREIELTWKHILTIWWSMTWRYFVVAIFSFLASTLIFLVLVSLLNATVPPTVMNRLQSLGAALFGLPLGFWVLHSVLTKRFRNFRIALLPLNNEAQQGAQPDAGTGGKLTP